MNLAIFRTTDAIELLKCDHRKVESLFEEFRAAKAAVEQVELAQTICTELMLHAQIEEELFYPAARDVLPKKKQKLIAEAAVEHMGLKRLIADIDGGSAGDAMFAARMQVLCEYVRHHVREEEKELMPAVRLAHGELNELGERITQRKETLRAEFGRMPTNGTVQLARSPLATLDSPRRVRTSAVRTPHKKKTKTKRAPARKAVARKRTSAKRVATKRNGTPRKSEKRVGARRTRTAAASQRSR